MSPSPSRRNLNPTVEDAIEDSSDEKKNGYAKSTCNVAVKRSTDLSKHKLADHTSDSGYSSRTATSKRSADSAKSSKDNAQDPTAKPEAPSALPPADTPAEEPKDKKRTSKDPKKPTKPVIRQDSKREEKPARAESRTRKSRRDSLPVAPHADPESDRRRRHRLSVDTKVDFARTSGRGSQYHPSSARDRTPADQGAESGGSRPRLYPSGSRPVSYHGGSSSSDYMNVNQPPRYYHGPPPAMLNSPSYWMGSPVGPQFPHYHGAMGLPSPLTPHGDPRFNNRGPVLHQGTQQAARSQPRYNPRYGQPQSAIPSPRQEEYDDDEEGYDPVDQYDLDRQEMPPPPIPRQRRPSAPKQVRTTPHMMPSMYRGWEDEGRYDDTDFYDEDEDPRLPRQFAALTLGNTGRGRSATSPDSRNSGGRAHVALEPAQSRDKRRDLTRRNTVYNTIVPSQAEPGNGRRDRADERRKSQIDDKERRVEEYVRGMNGINSSENPIDRLRTDSHRRTQSTASPRTKTHVSSRNGLDDGKSRVSDSAGTALSRKTNNLIIKVHDNDDTVEIQGDVSGKAIRFSNGEVIIADARDKEKYYIKDSSHTTENTSSSRSRGESDTRRTKVSTRTERDRRPRQAEQWVQQDQWRQPDQWRSW
ncbi:uncharacterized protein J3D65DRAFT_667732 [Phyllosticta citribraziliensis]|uniref:Uncharacterized protein n=1 Tax=Phyllosticta citribraziliensis TaxID=989973 RepID=A0ABR1LQS4_9PEZI